MAEAPSASVVVAAYRSDAVIEDCLRALHAQTVRDFETIVVNSSPGDRTREIVTAGFPDVRFIEHPTRLLPHAARNIGVRAATGRILAFTDADCRPAPDWLARCLAAQQAGHDVVCGSIEPERTGWFDTGVHLCKYSFRLAGLPPGSSTVAGTANTCYSRAIWEALGPFRDDVFAGDVLLGWEAARRGSTPWFEPSASVRHVFDHTPVQFLRERYERGQDFLKARAAFNAWSGWRVSVYGFGALVLPLVPTARAARDAGRAGWTGRFLWTLPIQLAGHVAWSLGEARAAFALLGPSR